MRTLPPFSVTVNTAQDILGIDNGTAGIEIQNESNFSLQISGAASKWIPAWCTDFVDLEQAGGANKITVTPYAILSSTASPPAANFLATIYNKGDAITGTYPYAMSRMVTASAVSQSALNLLAPDELQGIYLDDTDIPGVLTVIPTQEPTPTGVLELGFARRVNASQATLFLQSDNTTGVPTARAKLPFCFDIDTGTYIKGMQIKTGTGPGTPGHSLGIIPQAIIISCTNGNVANNPVSTGLWTISQFNVYCAAGTNWYALVIG